MQSTIKLLCVIEATTVTGPAKNLLNFCRLMRAPEFSAQGAPRIEISPVTFDRVNSASSTGGPREENAFVAAARNAGVEIDVIAERFCFDARVIRELRALIDRRAPDIIQTHGVKSHFLAKVSRLSRKCRWIAYHHGYTATDLKMQAYNQLNRWSLPSADRVITVCGEFAKHLAQSGVQRDRIKVRHNSVVAPRSVTADERQRLRERFGLGSDQRVVLSVGRLSREKGHADLIEAVSMLRELDSELRFKLLVVGEGPELQPLQRTVAERGLDPYLIFIGHVSDIAPFYAIADVLALPSHSEGSPNVLLEAMAAGLPVVATCVGGVPEIATNEESALLVPPRNPPAFAEALRRVLNESALTDKLKSNAVARARDFSPESHTQSLIEIYREIVSGPGAVATGSYAQRDKNKSIALPDVIANRAFNSQRLFDPVATAPGSDTARGTDTI